MTDSTSRLCFLGDSITNSETAGRFYWQYIADMTGAKVHCFGVNGAQTIDLLGQLDEMKKKVGDDFDTLFIFAGTNDFNHSVPLGSFFTEHECLVPTDSGADGEFTEFTTVKKREFVFDTSTFRGRLNTVLSEIRKSYTDKRIILLTPIHRAFAFFGGSNIQPDELHANKIGEYFESYIQAEREAADIWATELIDLYRDSGLFPLYENHAESFFCNKERDCLHPNCAGQEKIARAILRRLG